MELGTVERIGADHFDLIANAPLANDDGLNYMHKRSTVGTQANKIENLGENAEGRRRRVFPNEPMSALPGLKPGAAIHRNRDHQWEAGLQKKSAERKVTRNMTLAEHADGLRLVIRDEDGIASVIDAAIRSNSMPGK